MKASPGVVPRARSVSVSRQRDGARREARGLRSAVETDVRGGRRQRARDVRGQRDQIALAIRASRLYARLEEKLRALAEDLRTRGKLDLTEAYVDGSHAGAKRGVLLLGSLAAARRPRSWQWQTDRASPSPCTSKALLLTK